MCCRKKSKPVPGLGRNGVNDRRATSYTSNLTVKHSITMCFCEHSITVCFLWLCFDCGTLTQYIWKFNYWLIKLWTLHLIICFVWCMVLYNLFTHFKSYTNNNDNCTCLSVPFSVLYKLLNGQELIWILFQVVNWVQL